MKRMVFFCLAAWLLAARALSAASAQALQQLLVERHIVASVTDNKLWSQYQAAVSARDRAEQAASRASTAEERARRDLAAKQEARAASDLIVKAQAALEAETKKFEEAQSALLGAILSDRRSGQPQSRRG